jgi:hypothetical protein
MTAIPAKRMATGNKLLRDIQAAEDQAMRDGFPISSRALNQAKNALGWEMASNLAMADMARIGKRAGEP